MYACFLYFYRILRSSYPFSGNLLEQVNAKVMSPVGEIIVELLQSRQKFSLDKMRSLAMRCQEAEIKSNANFLPETLLWGIGYTDATMDVE